MGLVYDNWLRLWNRISPQVDSRQIDRILAEARQSLPTPVFWMLGKVQQGKTFDHPRLDGPQRRRDR